MRRALAVIAAGLVSACVQGNHVTKRHSLARLALGERDAAFARALSAVQRGGWLIAVSDRAAGLITSQAMASGPRTCGSITCDSRSTLQIAITETGDVSVNLHREFLIPDLAGNGRTQWFVPTFEHDVRLIEREQDRILNEIVPASATSAQAASSSPPSDAAR